MFFLALENPPTNALVEKSITFYLSDGTVYEPPISRFRQDVFPSQFSHDECVAEMCKQLREAKDDKLKQIGMTACFEGTSAWWLMSDDEVMRVFAEITSPLSESDIMRAFVGNRTRRSSALQDRIVEELRFRFNNNRQKIDTIQTLEDASNLAQKLAANIAHLARCGIDEVEGWPEILEQLYQKVRPLPQPFFYQYKIPVFTYFINCVYGSELHRLFPQVPLPIFRKIFVHTLTYEMMAPGIQLRSSYACHRLGSERAFFDCLWEARARKLLSPAFRLWRRIRFG